MLDLVRLLTGLPRSHRIFLREEYDRLPLARLARAYRRYFLRRTRVVAVVGSLGKTTTKRALDAALGCPDRSFSYSNYGSSLSENVLRIRPGDRHAVIEAGIAAPGSMIRKSRLIQPNLVVVTSIASEHNRSFPTLLDTRAEKVKIVRRLPTDGIAILNGDDPNVRWMASQTKSRVVTFGLNQDNDIRAVNVCSDGQRTTFDMLLNGATYRVGTRLLGDHMIYAALAALTVVHMEQLDLPEAISRLGELHPTVSRMELITLPDGTRILDDSSKGAVESMHAAFNAFSRMSAARKVVVLGEVEEPPGKQRDVYRELGRRLARFADLIICVGGDSMKSVRSAAVQEGMDPSAIRVLGSRIPEAIEALNRTMKPGDLVLVKGSGTRRLRRVVLSLTGTEVTCKVKHCVVKVRSCDVCPLLEAPQSWYGNHYVRRYIRP